MILECTKLTRPFATSLIVRAVDFQANDSLLEMNIAKVVEVGCLARGTDVVEIYLLLDTTFAVMLSTADDLSWVTEHGLADLADEFIGNLSDKVVL